MCTHNSDLDRHVKKNLSLTSDATAQLQNDTELYVAAATETIQSSRSGIVCNGDVTDAIGSGSVENMCRPISDLCKMITRVLLAKQHEDQVLQKRLAIEAEWRYLALILDRMFMILYLTVVVVSVALLFPK